MTDFDNPDKEIRATKSFIIFESKLKAELLSHYGSSLLYLFLLIFLIFYNVLFSHLIMYRVPP